VQVSFDRAADYYDATRALPADARTAVTGILSAELGGRGACLEIGVGTGRIALPLHDRGISMIGTDIAPAMLARLVANAGGRWPFPLLLADAAALPLADGSVGAVLACHVLHLIGDWRAAADEVFRVLAPGGALLADLGDNPPSPLWDALLTVLSEHGLDSRGPGLTDPADLQAYLGYRAAVRPLPPVPVTEHRVPELFLRDVENQIFSWTWGHEPSQLQRAAAGLRERAAGLGISLAEPVEVTRTIQWLAYDRRD